MKSYSIYIRLHVQSKRFKLNVSYIQGKLSTFERSNAYFPARPLVLEHFPCSRKDPDCNWAIESNTNLTVSTF